MGEPNYEFKCMVDGRTARGLLYGDRIELVVKTPLRRPSTQTIPIRSLTSVTSARDGMAWQKITLHVGGGATIDFRVAKGRAEEVASKVQALLF